MRGFYIKMHAFICDFCHFTKFSVNCFSCHWGNFYRWTHFYWGRTSKLSACQEGQYMLHWLLCISIAPLKTWQQIWMARGWHVEQREGEEGEKKKNVMWSPSSATCMSVAMGFVPPQSLTLVDYLSFRRPANTSHILCGTIHQAQQTTFSRLCGWICPIITARGELAISCLT